MKRPVNGAIASASVGAGLAIGLVPKPRRLARRAARTVGRRLEYAGGVLLGLEYRLHGHPVVPVGDDILADRIRSALGSVTKRLDVPHVHVTVERGVAILHGAIADVTQEVEIVRAVRRVAGVSAVESRLDVGLKACDTRPSAGRQKQSKVLRRLLDAAGRVDVEPADRWAVVRAVVATLYDRLPDGERDHLLAHLPVDVRQLGDPTRPIGGDAVRTVAAFTDRVMARVGELAKPDAIAASVAVLRELRAAVPDEAADVAAVLPSELRELWPRRALSSH